MLPEPVGAFIAAQGWGRVTGWQPVAGGCINYGRVLITQSGARLFLKINDSAPPDMFQCEAEGLAAIAAVPGAPRVPAVLLPSKHFLLLEYLSSAAQSADYWPELGRGLAKLHSATSESFGFDHNNYLGSTPQLNQWTADGYAFFTEQRLLFQAGRAHQRGLLSAAGLRRTARLAAKLGDLVPPQAASLIHGDLWSGNIIPGPTGYACLIDPAAHYGWAEAELAMTALFGRPPESFYSAYAAEHALAPGYRSRFDIYNLYHLLNHLNLFGVSYLPAVELTLDRYG